MKKVLLLLIACAATTALHATKFVNMCTCGKRFIVLTVFPDDMGSGVHEVRLPAGGEINIRRIAGTPWISENDTMVYNKKTDSYIFKQDSGVHRCDAYNKFASASTRLLLAMPDGFFPLSTSSKKK